MIKLATDEDFNNRILRGVLRRQPELDIRRKQDAGIGEADDPQVLDWAASEGRILLTHDASTMAGFAYARVLTGQPMPGVFEVRQELPIGIAIEEVLLLAECSNEGEWEGQVGFLPL
jgi:predicted nuclease of predicted toxin-antitoxin system